MKALLVRLLRGLLAWLAPPAPPSSPTLPEAATAPQPGPAFSFGTGDALAIEATIRAEVEGDESACAACGRVPAWETRSVAYRRGVLAFGVCRDCLECRNPRRVAEEAIETFEREELGS